MEKTEKNYDKRFIIRSIVGSIGDTEIIHKKTKLKWLHRMFGMFNREGYVSAIFGGPIDKKFLDFLDKEAKLIYGKTTKNKRENWGKIIQKSLIKSTKHKSIK